LWDYAEGLESRGHTVRVYAQGHAPANDADVVARFRARFDTVLYDNWADVADFADLDFVYMIKAGLRDGLEPRGGVRWGVHAVFPYFDPHGDVYAYISRWLAGAMSRGVCPYVPHIVELPDVDGDLRAVLDIPEHAVVFGRHGGYDTFDVPFVWAAVSAALEERDDVWFVFMNTAPGIEHQRVVYLDPTPDPAAKVRFINTCDAMLHARSHGETFGLAPAEFSLRNKPVLTYGRSHERAHIDILGDKALLYRTKGELVRLLLAQERHPAGDWNAYRDYSRDAVIDQFERVFLGIEPSRAGATPAPGPASAPSGYEGLYWALRRLVLPNTAAGRAVLAVRRMMKRSRA